MKITKRQLRRIIKEAITTVSDEDFDRATMPGYKGPQPSPQKSIDGELSAAGLSTPQINAMESEYKDTNGAIWGDDDAFDKMFNYYMDTEQMPYEYAKGRAGTPDEWILMHWEKLESTGMGFRR